MEAAADGNQQAWLELVDVLSPTVWEVIKRSKLPEADTADVAQAIWLRFLERIGRIKHADADHLRRWLAVTAQLECVRCREENTERTIREARQLAQRADEARAYRSRDRGARRRVVSPQRLTTLAAFVAGPERSSSLLDEWRSHLSGETGHGLTRRDQIRDARGFLLAAVRCRLRDTAAMAWRPVDALLGSRTLSNLFVMIPTAMAALFILRREGTIGVVTSAEGISAIGGALYMLVRVGRWWRNVKPPEPKARRVKE
jgi:DNA-directed RNA polymerase specialized sigma24 family protein